MVPDFFYGDAFPGDAGPVGNSSALPIWLKTHIPVGSFNLMQNYTFFCLFIIKELLQVTLALPELE